MVRSSLRTSTISSEELLGLLAHALGHHAHLAAASWRTCWLDPCWPGSPWRGAHCSHVLLLDARRDLTDHVLVVAHVLLDLLCMDVEIEHAVRECIEEIGVVRDDQAGLLVIDQELGEVLDTGFVEIVGGLIEEKDVGVLDQSRSEKEASLLSAGKGLDDAVFEVDDFILGA